MTDGAAGSLTIDRVRTAELVAEALRQQLLSGAFPLGAPMRDVELSARAGVSRTTMREALALLVREGLLTHALHRGVEVARIAASDVRDIYAARRVLERAGLESLLADPAPPLADLERSVTAMAEAANRRDMRGVIEADVAFHTALVAARGVRRLTDAETRALMELRLVLSLADRAYGDPAEQVRQHRQLLDRIRSRRPAAVALLDDHLTEAAELVAGVLEASEADRPGRTRPR
jgi:DNA-binding GntR family transcriptional regulator